MSQSPISRRDWFRLRLSPSASSPSDSALDDSDEGSGARSTPSNPTPLAPTPLAPVPEPPNHDGMDLSQLPPMREALLEASQLDELASDIQTYGQQIQLLHRGLADSKPNQTPMPSSEQISWAISCLQSGQIQRLQIRYRWNSALWIDTLENRSGSFRLVRIQHATG